jgi:hypothetical protein
MSMKRDNLWAYEFSLFILIVNANEKGHGTMPLIPYVSYSLISVIETAI